MSMQGGIMDDQTQAERPLIVPFASLPDPATVPGQVRMLSDVPGVEVVARGIWRPRGGRQVLAMRTLNPVTVQNLSGDVAETIGPFPGGLVRAGMRLEIDHEARHSGIGAGTRIAHLFINSNLWSYTPAVNSGSDLMLRRNSTLDVISDTNATHRRLASTVNSFTAGNIGSTIVADFSAPWSVNVSLTSCAETAVNITSASWAAGVATFGTSAAHTLEVGDKTVIAGVSPSGYNVAAGAIVTEVPTTTSFKVAIASDPGAYTSGGTSSRISNMISQSYVLSLIG